MNFSILNRLKYSNIHIFLKGNIRRKHQKCVSLIYEEHGDPIKTLSMVKSVLETPKKNEVLVKMLASPINPADINMIQGVYPILPMLPCIGGNEGVGEVLEIGSNVKDIKLGDWVVPSQAGWGTWRSHAVSASDCLMSVSKKLSPVAAATLAINPCTAYRMLQDFSDLQKGDVVIQNAANSAVGQAVIQIAKEMGLRTVNIVRKRSSVEDVIKELQNLGGTHVVTDEFARSSDMKNLFMELPKAKLALNSVGGKAVMDIVKHMNDGSCLVTYGGMSKQPLMLATGAFIFKNIRAEGFWMTRWTELNQGSAAQKEMFTKLTAFMLNGKLLPPKHVLRKVGEYKEAFTDCMQAFHGNKQVFTFDEHDIYN